MHHTIRTFGLLLAAGTALLLAGCVTPGYGGYGYPGGGYGQGGGTYPSNYGSQVQGTVEGVDPSYGRITLLADDPRSGYGQRLSVRYDRNTRLYYQGREHPVDGLERGDVIRFDAVTSGRELYARQIEVVRNVRDGSYGGGMYANDLRGTVGYVDTRARVIQLDGGGYGGGMQVVYDNRTVVEYQGRTYRPENLQRGDLVRVQARQAGYNTQWMAERIYVERSQNRGW